MARKLKTEKNELVPVEIQLTAEQAETLMKAFGGKDVAEAILNLLYMGKPPEELKKMTEITLSKPKSERQKHG